MDKSLKHGKVLGVKVSVIRKNEVIDFVKNSLNIKHKFFITTPNPEIVLKAQRDRELLDALNKADVALADGVGLVWAAGFLGLPKLTRATGRELFLELLKLANKSSFKIYLLGATPSVNGEVIKKIKRQFPRIEVKGEGGPVYDNNLSLEIESDIKYHKDIIKHINDFRPDLLFVALGAPKQEKWINRYLPEIKVGGAMVVGGTFDYFSGRAVLPPGFVARAGLEWLWRGLLEPARFLRILNATLVFPALVIKEKLSK